MPPTRVEYKEEVSDPQPHPEEIKETKPLLHMQYLLDKVFKEENFQSKLNIITEYFLYCLYKQKYIHQTFTALQYREFADTLCDRCTVFLSDPIIEENLNFQNVLTAVKAAYKPE